MTHTKPPRTVDPDEIQKAIDHARSIHGDQFNYIARRGTRVNLEALNDGEYVCAGGDWFHILMTPKNAD